jgi:hypothetical protein
MIPFSSLLSTSTASGHDRKEGITRPSKLRENFFESLNSKVYSFIFIFGLSKCLSNRVKKEGLR